MDPTLSPVTATTLFDQMLDSSFEESECNSMVVHLAAKVLQLLQLFTERLQLCHVHAAVHREEEQQHVVLLEALAGEDPLGEAVLHDGEGGEGRAGERGEEEIGGALAPPLLVPLQGLRLGRHRPLPPRV